MSITTYPMSLLKRALLPTQEGAGMVQYWRREDVTLNYSFSISPARTVMVALRTPPAR